MNIYKIKLGISGAKMITRENFMNDTRGKSPYFQVKWESQLAICPHCGNPIQIIGLFSEDKINSPKRKPYGKHYPHSVPELAEYNQMAYENCPYANPNRKLTNKSVKGIEDPIAKQIKQNVIENFDRIVVLLEDEFEISLSENILKKMLDNYKYNKGHSYVGATLVNYPWTFGYMTWRKSIFGMRVKPNSELYKVLEQDKTVNLQDGRINRWGNEFLSIAYYNMNHQIAPLNADEFMDYYIFIQNEKDKDRTAYKKRIVFDYDKYERIKAKLSGSNRNQRLLDLAKEYLG